METLFADKTSLGLDRFLKGLRNSIRPIVKGAYGKLSDCRRWRPYRKSLGPALFFDAPKNNRGFFYYRPLKICRDDIGVRSLAGNPKEGLTREGCTKDTNVGLPIWSFPNHGKTPEFLRISCNPNSTQLHIFNCQAFTCLNHLPHIVHS